MNDKVIEAIKIAITNKIISIKEIQNFVNEGVAFETVNRLTKGKKITYETYVKIHNAFLKAFKIKEEKFYEILELLEGRDE